MTDQFRINEPQVISEVMQGELVLVHFQSGCYYSVRGVGADICQLLSGGNSPNEVIHQVAMHYDVPESQISAEVHDFIASIVDENLLVPSAEQRLQDQSIAITARSYSAPRFEKFDDMADQLLLDPIHEIDETGWPLRTTG